MTDTQACKIAVIGAGIMGLAIATRLIETGQTSPSWISTRPRSSVDGQGSNGSRIASRRDAGR